MNVNTLLNVLVNTRQELWLAESVIPPPREKSSAQAGLPWFLKPCAETLACEDESMLEASNAFGALAKFSIPDGHPHYGGQEDPDVDMPLCFATHWQVAWSAPSQWAPF